MLTEKTTQYHLNTCFAVVDFYKTFDFKEHWTIRNSLKNARVDHRYIRLIKYMYEKAKSMIRLVRGNANKIKIEREREKSKLALKKAFKQLQRQNRGILINGKRFNYLCFVDDIVFMPKVQRNYRKC